MFHVGLCAKQNDSSFLIKGHAEKSIEPTTEYNHGIQGPPEQFKV